MTTRRVIADLEADGEGGWREIAPARAAELRAAGAPRESIWSARWNGPQPASE